MLDALFSGASFSAYAPYVSRLERDARARISERVLKLDKSRLNEEAALCATAAGEARALSCQKDNISRNSGKVINQTYYNRAGVALQVNVARWCLSIGRFYAPEKIRQESERVGITPEMLEFFEAVAREHVAEMTITIPHFKNEDLTAARRRFARVWNDFNRRFLKEIGREFFGSFIRVFEAHKDGVLHAHIMIECKQSLRRYDETGKPIPFKWRTFGGRTQVDGRSVARWVSEIWQRFRNGDFEKIGVGKIHTLQPIRKGITEFSRYISKYISKDIAKRPPHLKGVRLVAYSQSFLNGERLRAYDYDKSKIITYWSAAKQRYLKRPRRFTSFSIECASTRIRRTKIRNICETLGVSEYLFKTRIGAKWGFLTRNLISSFPLKPSQMSGLNKYERAASVRDWFGNRWNAVYKFDCGKRLLTAAEFMKINSAARRRLEYNVVGFMCGSDFVSVSDAYNNLLKIKIRDDLAKIRKSAQTKIRAAAPLSELTNIYDARRDAFLNAEKGNMSWREFARVRDLSAARLREIHEEIEYFYDDSKKGETSTQTEIENLIQTEMEFEKCKCN